MTACYLYFSSSKVIIFIETYENVIKYIKILYINIYYVCREKETEREKKDERQQWLQCTEINSGLG